MDDSKSNQDEEITHLTTNCLEHNELKIGMKVNSKEENCDLYNDYAIQKGFSIRKAQIRRGKGDVIRQRNYVCWK